MNSKLYDDDEANDQLLMRFLQSQKAGNYLIQNCDLPPPMRRKNIRSVITNNVKEEEVQIGVMKALQLSQTRAREAEGKCESIGKEMESIVFAFMEDSMKVFGYKQLLMLLEFQVSQFQKQRDMAGDDDDGGGGGGGSDGRNSEMSWMIALALCLGAAGVGFAIGYNYHLF